MKKERVNKWCVCLHELLFVIVQSRTYDSIRQFLAFWEYK